MSTSIPRIDEFQPLPMQLQVIRDIRRKFDYSKGTHEVLLSGSVGSAKSLLLAHLAVTHALTFPNAHVGFGRRTMPELKETLIFLLKQHIDGIFDYQYNNTTANFILPNGSRITSFSWADQAIRKFRSHEFSMFVIEELTENKKEDFYEEIFMRMGRLTHIPESIVLCASNPDDPEHWAFKRFIESDLPTRHVYYSKTADNPYLPVSYVQQLEENLDPKMARRMLYGEWLAINSEVIYYAYDKPNNFRKYSYQIDPKFPIHITFDFNIGLGKPFSLCCFQFINNVFHVFHEVIVHSSRTVEALEELAGRGMLDHNVTYEVNGDATGKHKDTRSLHSDYDIIKKFLDNYETKKKTKIAYRVNVPLSNPKVRERHNIMNAQFQNEQGARRCFVYQDCPTVDEGLRLTKLKPGAQYIEDDSKAYQHVTTALGYGMIAALRNSNNSGAIGLLQR